MKLTELDPALYPPVAPATTDVRVAGTIERGPNGRVAVALYGEHGQCVRACVVDTWRGAERILFAHSSDWRRVIASDKLHTRATSYVGGA